LQEGNAVWAPDLNDFKFHIHPSRDFARDIGIKPVNLVAFIEGAKGRQGWVDAGTQTAGRKDLIERPCLRRQSCTSGHRGGKREKGAAICRGHFSLLLGSIGRDPTHLAGGAAR
jgi:hypothetical protein